VSPLAGPDSRRLPRRWEETAETFDSTCCGMAGSFGYEAEHHEMSLKIGELSVLPKMRSAPPDTLLAACGISCRHQIADGAGRVARHIVRILDDACATGG
jgi:Fe-S oxidoreductase